MNFFNTDYEDNLVKNVRMVCIVLENSGARTMCQRLRTISSAVRTISSAVHTISSAVHALPSYLSASLCNCQTSRDLRHSSERFLKISERSLKPLGERSFRFIAPSV